MCVWMDPRQTSALKPLVQSLATQQRKKRATGNETGKLIKWSREVLCRFTSSVHKAFSFFTEEKSDRQDGAHKDAHGAPSIRGKIDESVQHTATVLPTDSISFLFVYHGRQPRSFIPITAQFPPFPALVTPSDWHWCCSWTRCWLSSIRNLLGIYKYVECHLFKCMHHLLCKTQPPYEINSDRKLQNTQ